MTQRDESVSEEARILRFIAGLSDDGLSRVSPILIEQYARRLRELGELSESYSHDVLPHEDLEELAAALDDLEQWRAGGFEDWPRLRILRAQIGARLGHGTGS